jgi:hypothetical protein
VARAEGVVDQVGVGGVEVAGPVGVGEQRHELGLEVFGEAGGELVGVAGGAEHTAGQMPQAALDRDPGEHLGGEC